MVFFENDAAATPQYFGQCEIVCSRNIPNCSKKKFWEEKNKNVTSGLNKEKVKVHFTS